MVALLERIARYFLDLGERLLEGIEPGDLGGEDEC